MTNVGRKVLQADAQHAVATGIGPVIAQGRVNQHYHTMLRWVATFFIIALIAAFFGFTGIAASTAYIAKVLFFIFLVLLVLSLLFGKRIWKDAP